jgi:hypothetical protein
MLRSEVTLSLLCNGVTVQAKDISQLILLYIAHILLHVLCPQTTTCVRILVILLHVFVYYHVWLLLQRCLLLIDKARAKQKTYI